MGPLIIYHGNCIDGFTAAWACWLRYRDAEFFPAHYSSGGTDVELPDVAGRDVVIVDFCTSRDQLLRLKAEAQSLVVFDHHKTAEAACAGLDFCTFDMQRSGAGLAWDCVHLDFDREDSPSYGQPRPRAWLIDYVEDRDLWRWALPRSKEVSAYISGVPQTFEAWTNLNTLGFERAADKGQGILAYVDRYVSEMSKQAKTVDFAGHEGVPFVNAPYINTSELVGHLAESAPFAVGWFMRGDGKFQYSLRSRGEPGVDVSEIAKRFGGGGHRNAAGFASVEPPWRLE